MIIDSQTSMVQSRLDAMQRQGEAAERAMGLPLVVAQLEGCACVVCARSHRPMLPLDIETRRSTHLFHCDHPECVADREAILRRIPVAERAT